VPVCRALCVCHCVLHFSRVPFSLLSSSSCSGGMPHPCFRSRSCSVARPSCGLRGAGAPVVQHLVFRRGCAAVHESWAHKVASLAAVPLVSRARWGGRPGGGPALVRSCADAEVAVCRAPVCPCPGCCGVPRGGCVGGWVASSPFRFRSLPPGPRLCAWPPLPSASLFKPSAGRVVRFVGASASYPVRLRAEWWRSVPAFLPASCACVAVLSSLPHLGTGW
jgi:hypothetical protein